IEVIYIQQYFNSFITLYLIKISHIDQNIVCNTHEVSTLLTTLNIHVVVFAI
ncbi:hypothetical protein L9F63_026514, partial [Diploptera punctata]